MTHLRKIMLEELQRRNYAQHTTRSYIRAVEDFARHFNCSPDRLGPRHIREYQAELFEKRKSAGSVAVRLAALRFFYCKTLKRAWNIADTPYPKGAHRLPTILSKEEVAQLIQAASTSFHLREEEEQWTVHGVAANDSQKVADEAERGESRTSAAYARTHPRSGQVVASGGAWTQPVLRSAPEPKRAVDLSVPSGTALASRAVAAQPEWSCPLGSHAAPHPPLAACAFRLSSLSSAPHGRRYLRQEPDAGNPPVRIRGGGCERS